MAKITVYTTQGHLQYSAQIPCIRPRRKPPTPPLTLSQALCLMRHPDSGEHLQAPVVVTGDRHWSGFRPDHIDDLAHDAA
jgi:glutaredoxin-like protein NrdH